MRFSFSLNHHLRKMFFCFFVIGLCLARVYGLNELTFQNPLREDGADPFMVVHNNSYYLLVSRQDRINIIKADSLGSLSDAPETTVYQASGEVGNVWAPEMHFLNGPNGGRWYIYYTAGNRDNFDGQRTFVLESSGTDPLGPYTPKGRLFDPQNDNYAIDGTVFEQNGQLYFLWSGGDSPTPSSPANIYIAPLSNPWTLGGKRVRIATPQYDWEKVGTAINEAPAVLQRNGKIFVTYSASWCVVDYKLGMLTANAASNLLDPASWTKSPQPVLQGAIENGVFAPGHNSFFKSPDGAEDWIIYHGQTGPISFCGAGRSTRAQRFTWNADGTPNFSRPVSLDTTLALPSGENGVNATDIIPGAAYRIVNEQSSLCLDVPFGLPFGGIQLQQTSCNGLNPQHWYFSNAANGSYSLTAQKSDSNLCLDVRNGSSAPGTEVQQWYCNNLPPQRWNLSLLNKGYVKIVNATTNLYLDVANASGQAEAKTITAVGSPQRAAQNWRLERR